MDTTSPPEDPVPSRAKSKPSFSSLRDALKSPLYRAWIIGSLLSLIGFWAQRIGVGWLIWERTQSSTWVGIGVAADMAPVLLVSPLAGVLGDRLDRLAVVRYAQLVSIAVAAALSTLAFTGFMPIGLIIAIVAIGGAAHGIKQPSRMAMIRELVPGQALPAAIALGSITYNVARFIGPAVAGVAILVSGVGAVFALSALLGLTLFMAMGYIRKRHPRRTIAAATRGPAGFLSGLVLALSDPVIRLILALQLVCTVLVRGFPEILPAVSDRVFAMGASGLAILTTSFAAGAIMAGFWLARRAGPQGLYRTVLAANFSAACILATIAFAPSIWIAAALIVLLGFAISICGVGSQTLLQHHTRDEILARVLAVFGLVQWVGPATGALMLGMLSDRFGFTWPLIGLALSAVAASATFAVMGRRRMGDFS